MKDYKYILALSNYRSLTGDYDTQFESVEDIYIAIGNAVDNDGDATIIRPLTADITENGTYEFKKHDDIDAYEPVTINVNIDNEDVYNQGYNVGYEEGTEIGRETGYNQGFGEGEANQKSKLEDIEIVSNGNYSKEDGYKNVNVNVDGSGFYNEGFEAGKTEGYNQGFGEGESNQKSKLEDIEIVSNGNYSKEDGYKNVTVKVPAGLDFSVIGYGPELSGELNGDFQADIDYSKSLYDKHSGVLSGGVTALFKNDINLVYCPNFDTSNVTNMYYMFNECTNLQTIPQLNTSNVTNMYGMFDECTNLQTIPQLNTSNVTNMSYMFNECTNLQTIPQLDTSNVTDMRYMFGSCTNLQTIPQLDTSKVTNMSYMFNSCGNLQTIPQLDTSKVTNMSYMFGSCTNLQTIPLLDTSNVTNMGLMFTYCTNLQSIPQLNTSNVTNMYQLFYNCTNLQTIPLLDTSNVTAMNFAFGTCRSLTDIGGFKNLGMQKSLATGYMFSSTNNLTHDSVMNIINNLYDRAAVGYSTVTLPLGSSNLGRISDEEKAIATNKGWTLS